ncbi:MAG: hypothetical protein F6J93_21285 [Oscillatoria sp. SIO1A7]|nr:hypothetical protein [Oscillatoria sp. SIO1A7]
MEMTRADYPQSDSLPQEADLEKTFLELAEQWRYDTEMLSSITKKSNHPAYKKIISMGQAVVPLILREFERYPDHWFVALVAITGENPVSREDNFKQAVEVWLQWGRDKGLI